MPLFLINMNDRTNCYLHAKCEKLWFQSFLNVESLHFSYGASAQTPTHYSNSMGASVPLAFLPACSTVVLETVPLKLIIFNEQLHLVRSNLVGKKTRPSSNIHETFYSSVHLPLQLSSFPTMSVGSLLLSFPLCTLFT